MLAGVWLCGFHRRILSFAPLPEMDLTLQICHNVSSVSDCIQSGGLSVATEEEPRKATTMERTEKLCPPIESPSSISNRVPL